MFLFNWFHYMFFRFFQSQFFFFTLIYSLRKEDKQPNELFQFFSTWEEKVIGSVVKMGKVSRLIPPMHLRVHIYCFFLFHRNLLLSTYLFLQSSVKTLSTSLFIYPYIIHQFQSQFLQEGDNQLERNEQEALSCKRAFIWDIILGINGI